MSFFLLWRRICKFFRDIENRLNDALSRFVFKARERFKKRSSGASKSRLSDSITSAWMMLQIWFRKRFPRLRISPVQASVVFLVVLASVFALVAHKFTYRGLTPEALDLAQLSRNISEGKGFTTDFLRPISLSLAPGRSSVPDFFHAPLYPFVLALVMSSVGAHDGAVWGLSSLLLILSALLLFALARRLSGQIGTACLVAAIYVISVPVLNGAASGNPLVLSTCCLLALLLWLTPKPEKPEALAGATSTLPQGLPEQKLPEPALPEATLQTSIAEKVMQTRTANWERSMIFAGALAAFCYLTDYFSLLYVLPLVAVWKPFGREWNRRAAGLFLLGFALLSLPWWIRNFRLTGNPFYTLQWLELSLQSARYPGVSLLRDFDKSQALSLWHYLPTPLSAGSKLLSGLATYFTALPQVPHLYLMPFVVAAYCLPTTPVLTQRLKKGLVLALVFYVPVLCLLNRLGTSYLVPFAGLLAYLGIVTAQRLLEVWMRDLEKRREKALTAAKDWKASTLLASNDYFFRVKAGLWMITGALLLLPLTWQILALRGKPLPDTPQIFQQLGKGFPAQRVVVTDAPWQVSWYAQRPALWLPQDFEQLNAINKVRPVGAIYLSSATLKYSLQEGLGGWQTIYKQLQEIPGFDMLPRPQVQDIIYLKRPSLAEAQQMAKARPRDPAARLGLGRAFLAAGQPKAALGIFSALQRQGLKSAELFRETGLACLQLKEYARAERSFGQARSLAPRDQKTLLLLAQALTAQDRRAQAIEVYEQVLADAPNQHIATNNLAFLYAKDNTQLYRAIAMAKRLVSADPGSASKWDTLGWANYRAGRAQEAAAQLQRAMQLAPERGIIRYHLGKVLLTSGQAEQGIALLSQALKADLPPAERRDAESLLARRG